MEIRWLEDFIALARTRHFSRAADEQNVTQPTFSRRIKLLEEEMRVTLIDRNTLPLTLTPAGEIFLQSAEQITRQLRDAKARCLSIRDQEQQHIRFVTTQSLFLGYYRETVVPLCERLSIDIDVNMNSSSWGADEFIKALMANECDVMLCFWHPAMTFLSPLDEERFECICLDHERLIPCVAPNVNGEPLFQLPGTRKSPVPYIAYDSGAFLAPAVDHHLQRQPDMAQLTAITSNLHAASIKAMVKESYGIGWLPERMIGDSVKFGSLMRAGEAHWDVPLEIRLYRDQQNPSRAMNDFWSKLKVAYPTKP